MVSVSLTLPAPGWLDASRRVYAIGDVHGCDERLEALHRLIERDVAASPPGDGLVVHLGDYVDRGPHSAGVVRRLLALPELAGMPVLTLRGNHEQMMLDALREGGEEALHWLANGGEATLQSWDVSADDPVAAWQDAVEGAELAFLQGLPLFHQVDGYVFVHAGLRPGRRLADQVADDMLWIRGGFLNHLGPILPEAPGTGVVHGHTPASQPERLGQRLGIDTGAVMGGALTCAVLEGRTMRFLTT